MPAPEHEQRPQASPPEAEPQREFTVIVAETYLVPYRIRARNAEEAVALVLDEDEGEELTSHREWAEGTDRFLYSVHEHSPALESTPDQEEHPQSARKLQQ